MGFNHTHRVRIATKDDIGVIKRITDECIGNDYYSEQKLEEVLEREGYYIFVYADENDIPVAYLYIFSDYYSIVKKEFNYVGDGLLPYGIKDDTFVGVYKTACTSKEYRKTGILTKFLNELEKELLKSGAEYIIFEAIKLQDGKVPVDGPVRSVGFEPRFEVSRPWIGIDSHCPYCGKDHCECDGVIYSKKLK